MVRNSQTTTLLSRLTIIFGLALLLLSCGERSRPTAPVGYNTRSSQVTVPLIHDQGSRSWYQQELSNLLDDPTVGQYYKDVYIQGKLVPADDDKMLSITDSLFTQVPNRRLFYFIVFTKSMNGADGFYAEAVGLSAVDFVTTRTEWFAEYFNMAPELTDADMDNWAEFVYGEFQISEEGNELIAVKELEHQLIQNITGLRGEYKPIIERLIARVRTTAHAKSSDQ